MYTMYYIMYTYTYIYIIIIYICLVYFKEIKNAGGIKYLLCLNIMQQEQSEEAEDPNDPKPLTF